MFMEALDVSHMDLLVKLIHEDIMGKTNSSQNITLTSQKNLLHHGGFSETKTSFRGKPGHFSASAVRVCTRLWASVDVQTRDSVSSGRSHQKQVL